MSTLLQLVEQTDFSKASYPDLQWLHDVVLGQDDGVAYRLFVDKYGPEYLATAKHDYITMAQR